VPQEINQIVAEHTERLKMMMRQGEGLSEKENMRNGGGTFRRGLRYKQ